MASRTLCLMALLVASFCVAAIAGPVTPTLGTSKLGQFLPKVCITLQLIVDTRGLPAAEPVVLIIKDVQGGAAVLALVGGAITPLDPVVVCLALADTLSVSVGVFGMKKDIAIPLSALNPVVTTLGDTVKTVLALVQTVVDGSPVVAVVNNVKAIVATIPIPPAAGTP